MIKHCYREHPKQASHLKLGLLVGLLCFSTACSSTITGSAPPSYTLPNPISPAPSYSDQMVTFARDYIGTKYVWGGITPKGFDCSGFIKFVYNEYDIQIPRTTSQYKTLAGDQIALEEAKVGDLIVFTGTDPSIRKPGHAGIITQVGEDKLHFIHSSSSKKHFGVTETDYFKSGYPKRYLYAVRMSQDG